MSIIKLKDWDTKGTSISALLDLKNLNIIAGKKITDFKEQYKSLYVYDNENISEKDKIHDDIILSVHETENNNFITTQDLMGFIGIRDKNTGHTTQIHITSRFTENDNFLYYMLEKVYNYNLYDFETSTNESDILDFLPLLFPNYFEKALAKGVYKEYQWQKYNNSNPKGVIDIPRHIKLNSVDRSKIAYKMREQKYDNKITQLIRHTLEYIKQSKFKNILEKRELQEYIANLYNATQSYKIQERNKIIRDNWKDVKHPYYVEYEYLRQLCLRILNTENVVYDENDNEIYGVLFEASKLWEGYVGIVLKEQGLNVKEQDRKQLFKVGEGTIRPDFVINKGADNTIIADTKYKNIEKNNNADYYQVITYMLYYGANTGYLIYPYSSRDENEIDGNECNGVKLKEYEFNKTGYINENNFKKFIKIGLKISEKESYQDFKNEMKEYENNFIEKFKN